MQLQRLFHLLKLDKAALMLLLPLCLSPGLGSRRLGRYLFKIGFSLLTGARQGIKDERGELIILGRVEAAGACLFAPPAGWFPVTRGDTQFPELSGSGRRDRHRKTSSSLRRATTAAESAKSPSRPVHPPPPS